MGDEDLILDQRRAAVGGKGGLNSLKPLPPPPKVGFQDAPKRASSRKKRDKSGGMGGPSVGNLRKPGEERRPPGGGTGAAPVFRPRSTRRVASQGDEADAVLPEPEVEHQATTAAREEDEGAAATNQAPPAWMFKQPGAAAAAAASPGPGGGKYLQKLEKPKQNKNKARPPATSREHARQLARAERPPACARLRAPPTRAAQAFRAEFMMNSYLLAKQTFASFNVLQGRKGKQALEAGVVATTSGGGRFVCSYCKERRPQRVPWWWSNRCHAPCGHDSEATCPSAARRPHNTRREDDRAPPPPQAPAPRPGAVGEARGAGQPGADRGRGWRRGTVRPPLAAAAAPLPELSGPPARQPGC